MFKFVAAKSIAAIAAVGITACAAIFLSYFISVVPAAKAEPQIKTALHQPHAQADRLPASPKGTQCSSLGWPHYEETCQFDLRRHANEARTVRVIGLR